MNNTGTTPPLTSSSTLELDPLALASLTVTLKNGQPHQLYKPSSEKHLAAHVSRVKNLLVWGNRGGGKLLSIHTPIPTPTGYVTMGDLRVGDQVLDDAGKPCHVIHKSEPHIDMRGSYKLTFDDSTTVVCGGSHEWLTFDKHARDRLHRHTPEWREKRRLTRKDKAPTLKRRNVSIKEEQGAVRITEDIVNTLVFKTGTYVETNHAIKVAGAWQLPEKDYVVPPYVLGAWLGDGSKDSGSMTGLDVEIFTEIAKYGYTVSQSSTSQKAWYVKKLVTGLREIGVFNAKHIPPSYFLGSYEQRLALLQGLMDTDGNCELDGKAEFCNTNYRIARGVYRLAASLGVKPSWSVGRAVLNGQDYGLKFRVAWTAALPVFRLSRKCERLKASKDLRRISQFRFIVKAERIPDEAMQCIQVDSPTHLYLCTEACIPTHNSTWMRFDAHMRALTVPNSSLILVRKTYPQLMQALALDTLLSTPQGLRTMESLTVGDYVLGPDGKATAILAKSSPSIDTKGTYKITFDDGEQIVASAGHLWVTSTATERRARRRVESGRSVTTRNTQYSTVRTTEDIARSLTVERDHRSNHSIPLTCAWDLPDAPLPIDPYLLGLWLGDGTSQQAEITTNDTEILQQIEQLGYRISPRTHKMRYGICSASHNSRCNNLVSELRKLNLINNKHIPSIYLSGSYTQRLALLQGLMDTDGHVSKTRVVSFTQSEQRKHIAEGVHLLAASLGLKPRTVTHTHGPNSFKPGAIGYSVSWTSSLPVFRLTRKLARLTGGYGQVCQHRYIVACDRIADVITQCIAVDNESKQYLVGRSCIPTHNSHLIHINGEMDMLGGSYNKSEHIAYYPNGSKLFFSHVATEADSMNMLSAEFLAAYFDELSTIPWDFFVKLCASVRVKRDSGHIGVVRAATNPLGPSATEVFSYFVNKDVEPEDDPDYNPDDWDAIKIQMDDNAQHLDLEDYRKRFSGMPDYLRKAWLEGEFALENALFDFRKKTKEGKPWHVISELPFSHGKPIITERW